MKKKAMKGIMIVLVVLLTASMIMTMLM